MLKVATYSNAPRIMQWVGRGAAVLMFGFFMLFALGDGLPPLGQQPLRVQLEFAAFGVIFIGYALGWRHPGPGGILALLGLVGFNVVELASNGRLAGGALPLFAIPGVLYLVAWSWARAKGRTAVANGY
jgi:hypothetical protein